MDTNTKKLVRFIDENLGFDMTAPSRRRLREMFPEAFVKITRPRVVSDIEPKYGHQLEWRLVEGKFQFKDSHGSNRWLDTNDWYSGGGRQEGVAINPARIKLLYDLMQNPTEEVYDNG